MAKRGVAAKMAAKNGGGISAESRSAAENNGENQWRINMSSSM
jgi:hypothetical protein